MLIIFLEDYQAFFSNERDHGSNIQVAEGNELLQGDQKIVNELKYFF